MIYYIASDKNRERFDFIKENDSEFYVSVGEFDLKEKLMKRGGGFEHCGCVIIDHTAVANKTRDIIGNLQSFRLMYPVRIIYFYEGTGPDDSFYQALINAKLYNIITSEQAEDLAVEFGQCMAGRTEEEARTGKMHLESAAIRKSYRLSGSHIAVFGSEIKIGSTYMAFGLATFLANVGLSSGYVEIAEQSRLAFLPSSSAKMLSMETDESLEVNVVDFGVISQKKVIAADRFNKFVLCSGGQPWQSDSLSKALFMLMRSGHPVDIVFYLISEALKPQLLAKYTNNTVTVHFSSFAPDLANQHPNNKTFEALMKEWEI